MASNYDASGSAASAEAAAKSYTDGEIAKVDSAVAGVKTIAEQGVADAATAQAAADTAQAAADAAQGEVDALETYVGTLPENSAATSIVDYVNLKTTGIATDTALSELGTQVNNIQSAVNTISADYLTSADKTELSDLVKAEENRAKGIEGGLETRLATVEGDYLKAADKNELQGNIDEVAEDVADIAKDYLTSADKTELQNNIDAKVAQTAYDAKVEEIKGTTDSLQTQINTIMSNPDAEGAINSINEFTAWVNEHGTIADGMRTDINANAKAIEDEAKAARAAEEALSGRLDTLEAIDHEAYVGADAALKSELEGKINLKADASAMASAVEALEGADTAIKGRLDVIEAQLGEGEGSVADMIGDAKQEAIDTAAADATSKANAAEAAAKEHATGLNTAMNARVEALEAIDHDHSNKALLDTYTQTEANLADAVAKKHEHSNLEVLEGITATKVSAWDAAEQNAKTYAKDYADGLNTAMTEKVDGAIERIAANEGAITTINTELAKKALQTDLEAVSGRVTTIENWHANFVEVSEEEINSLFATQAN